MWFFNKGKSEIAALGCGVPGNAAPQCGKSNTPRADQMLFIDARHLYRQIDRAHRDWTPAQIEFLANIARLYRDEQPENLHDSANLLAEHGFLPSTSGARVRGEMAETMIKAECSMFFHCSLTTNH